MRGAAKANALRCKNIRELRRCGKTKEEESPYFIGIFTIPTDDLKHCVALSSSSQARCACVAATPQHDAERRASTRFVKRNTVFFIVL